MDLSYHLLSHIFSIRIYFTVTETPGDRLFLQIHKFLGLLSHELGSEDFLSYVGKVSIPELSKWLNLSHTASAW